METGYYKFKTEPIYFYVGEEFILSICYNPGKYTDIIIMKYDNNSTDDEKFVTDLRYVKEILGGEKITKEEFEKIYRKVLRYLEDLTVKLQMIYYVNDIGYTREDIEIAFNEKRIAITATHGDNCVIRQLHICNTPDEAKEYATINTIGQCYSKWEEVWGYYPENIEEVFELCLKGTLL